MRYIFLHINLIAVSSFMVPLGAEEEKVDPRDKEKTFVQGAINKDGVLSLEEYTALMRRVVNDLPAMPRMLAKTDEATVTISIAEGFAKGDADGSKTIDKTEFTQALRTFANGLGLPGNKL
jgi:hypothetical protein